ncbi:hypothetical protein, partial [Priestia megaterium]
TCVGGTALSLSHGKEVASSPEESTLNLPPTSSTRLQPAPIPWNVPSAFTSALFNRGFTDGRFIFRAWGKVQLAFKEFDISHRSISSTLHYISLSVEAVGLTVQKKGSVIAGDLQGEDVFLKYLYGVMKGLFKKHRSAQLTQFVEEIEGLSDVILSHVGMELEDTLKKIPVVDRELQVAKLRELEHEASARQRRKHYSNHAAFDLTSSLNQFKLFMKTDD